MCTPEIREETLIVMVVDVKRFMKATQGKSALETFRLLDTYSELVGRYAVARGGQVIKCIGDGVLMSFSPDCAENLLASLEDLKRDADALWESVDPDCEIVIRVHAGPVATGMLGPVGDKRFDAIGDTLNQLFTMRGEENILISEAARKLSTDLPGSEEEK